MKEKKWRGYSLEELHHRQATTALRIEMQKQQLHHAIECQLGGIGAEGVPEAVTSVQKAWRALMIGIKTAKIIKYLREKLRK